MSSPTNCLAGYKAFALRGTLPSLRGASLAVLRTTLVVNQQYSFTSQSQTTRVRSLACSRPLSLQPHVSQITAVARYASVASDPHDEELPTTPPFSAGPYSNLTVGVPKESVSFPGERRVAITPQNVALLLKKGFSRVLIERGAGEEAQFTDEAYEQAGAKTVDRRTVFKETDILLKVRALSTNGENSEVDAIREGATVISMLYPMQNRPTVERIASRKATAFAMDMVPRISRAQVFDALRYDEPYTPLSERCLPCFPAPWPISQATRLSWKLRTTLAAFSLDKSLLPERCDTSLNTKILFIADFSQIPPCKVLVIGAGVAGLSAIATVCILGLPSPPNLTLTLSSGSSYGCNCPWI